MVTFPLDIRTELKLPEGWTDISDDVYQRDAKRIVRGMRDLGVTADPSTLTLTLNNRDGKYSRRNPQSPLYGKIGRNTPVRLSLPSSSGSFLQLDGDPSGYAWADFAGITGDLDVRWEGFLGWYDPKPRNLIGHWDAENNDRGWVLSVYDGTVYLNYSADGTSSTTSFQFDFLPADVPEFAAVRATLDVDNGSGQRVASVYWAESMDANVWHFLASQPLTGAITLNVPDVPLRMGIYDTVYDRSPFDGRCTRAQVRSGIDGPIVADLDFRSMAAGTTSFTDGAGLNWTLEGSAQVRDREDRFVGEISSWPVEWSIDGADVWTSVTASGLLRRMGQGQKPIASALRRRLETAPNVAAYWPLEDESLSTEASSPIPGVRPAEVSGVSFAAMSDLVSSSPLVQLGESATLKAAVPSFAAGSWQVEFVYTAGGSKPSSQSELISVMTKNGRVRRWRLRMMDGNAEIRGFDSSNAAVVSLNVVVGDDVFAGWTRLRLQTTDNGDGTFDWRLDWQDVGGSAGGIGGTVSGSAGSVSALTANWGAGTSGWGIGHLTVFSTSGVTTFDGSDDGYTGETVWQRMRRLSVEENVTLTYRGGGVPGSQVGPQGVDTVLNLIERAALADAGMLTEDKRRLGLYYRSRPSMYSQTPKLTLDYTQPGLAPGLAPVDDDSAVRNDVTVQREFGSYARAVAETGPMSVADVGQYDESVTLSLADDSQTLGHACWRVHLGTFDGARYPAVTVMLHKPGAAALADDVMSLREGDVIRLRNLPPFVSYDDVDLMVLGWSEELDMYRWEVTFTCVPAEPWAVGELGNADVSRADAEDGQSVLAVNATADAASLIVATQFGEPWVTSSGRLTANPDFEVDLSGWSAVGGTLERVETPKPAPFGGDWSARLTPDGVTATVRAQSNAIAVEPGTVYRVNGWLRCAVARNVGLNVNWYDAGGLYMSTSATSHALAAEEWTEAIGTVTAPVGAVTARILPTLDGSPLASHVLEVDVCFLSSEAVSATAQDFPFDIRLGGETARVTACTPGVQDIFARNVASGWGTANVGGAWTLSGNAADFSVVSGYAAIDQPVTGIAHLAQLASPAADADLYVDVATSVLAAGSSLYGGPIMRAAGNPNFYMARLDFAPSGAISMTLRKRVANVESQIGGGYTSPLTHVAGTFYRVRMQAYGSALKAKVWLATQPEPAPWNIETTDTSLTAAGNVGVRAYANTGSTPVSPEVRFTNLIMPTPQRMTVDRSLNRVVKAHSAGTGVRLARPTYVGL